MAQRKAVIIYALTGNILTLAGEAKPLRDRGAAIRLVSLNEFRGETETGAAAVYVQDADAKMFDAVQQAYPHLEVQEFDGFASIDPFDNSGAAAQVDGDLKALRMRLVQLGGTVPAGASQADLAALIVAQEAGLDRTPNLPTPGSQGTVIPDSTPVMSKTDADSRVDTAATGSTAAVIAANEGEGGLQGQRAAASTPAAPTTDGASDGGDSDGGDSDLPGTHAELDKIAADEGVTYPEGTTKVVDKQAAIAAARSGAA